MQNMKFYFSHKKPLSWLTSQSLKKSNPLCPPNRNPEFISGYRSLDPETSSGRRYNKFADFNSCQISI